MSILTAEPKGRVVFQGGYRLHMFKREDVLTFEISTMDATRRYIAITLTYGQLIGITCTGDEMQAAIVVSILEEDTDVVWTESIENAMSWSRVPDRASPR